MEKRDLPEGWMWYSLGDVLILIRNGISSDQNKDHLGYPITRIETISDGSINPERIGYVQDEFQKILNYKINHGDILFSHINSVEQIGKTAIYEGIPKDLYHGVNLLLLRPNSEIVSPKYLFYYMNTPLVREYFRTRCKKAVNQASINQKAIVRIRVPVPPKIVQNRIVAIFDRAKEARRLRAQADKLFGEIALSVFIEIFGDLSKDPNLWEIKKMDEVTEKITDGEHATPIRASEGIYLLSARNIRNHDIALEDVDFIGTDEYERISKRIIPEKDDILVSCSGTIGRVARVKENFKFQMVRSVALIRPNKNLIDPIFLEYLFDTNFMKNQIERSVNQSSQANLFQGKIQRLLIPVPPMDLQYRYVIIIEKIESMKMKMMESNDNINNFLDVVLQRAFAGELIS